MVTVCCVAPGVEIVLFLELGLNRREIPAAVL